MDFIYAGIDEVEKVEWDYPSWDPLTSTEWGTSTCRIYLKSYSINGVEKPIVFTDVPGEIGMALTSALSRSGCRVALLSAGIPSPTAGGALYETGFGGKFKISTTGQLLF
ncbi:hypothetical protein TA3x_005665 [Tundrisphaera sp. TA3]|uniref:hypothetical protein n=1 Tax=Tundrisphaera sp. TA3 TaxID=3435775 RepID=UPI003EBCDFA6